MQGGVALKKLKLTDLIDVQVLQQLQDGFSKFTGMASLTTDEQGIPITKGSGFTDFCMNLTRQSELGCKRCETCDKMGAIKTLETGRASTYYCHAGLVDYAAPIMVEGRLVGSFIGGQVRTGEVDEEKIRAVAKELSLDEEEYLEAARRTPVLDKEKIDRTAEFLAEIAKVLSEMAYQNYLALQRSKRLERAARSQASYIMNMALNMEKTMSEWGPITEKAIESRDAAMMEQTLHQLKELSAKVISNVEDTVEYIRLSSGEVILSEAEYSVQELIQQVIDSVSEYVKNKKIRIHTQIQDGVPGYLLGDSGRIGMLLSKLLQNILPCTEEDISLVVSSEKISYSTWLIFSVKGFGDGVPEEKLQNTVGYLKGEDTKEMEPEEEGGIEFSVLGLLIKQLSGTIKLDKNAETVITIRLPQLDVGGESDGG